MTWDFRSVASVFLFVIQIMASNADELYAQEIPVQVQQQLENLLDAGEEETEDDTYWQQMERYSRHPLNINNADEEELSSLGLLSEVQINNLIVYRQMLGKLVSIYELQAVPGWEPALIRRLQPFLTVSGLTDLSEDLVKRLRGGTHTWLLRISQLLEKQKGFDHGDSNTKYAGSRQKIFARYRYTFRNLLQFGWSGDKDAGEQFLNGKQRWGFDFNSFHFFARNIGIIKAVAIGDFTVNLGQGLIHWQSLAFKKGGGTVAVIKQSPVLKPYNAAGEYNFHRGLGITIRRRNMEWTGFVSFRKLSANYEEGIEGPYVSSILMSGYHRTRSEMMNKNILSQVALGMSLRYKRNGLLVGLNTINHSFSLPIQKRDEPYNLFALSGKKLLNGSVDYAYTFRNIHFFGELAIDNGLKRAFIQGCVISADPKIDLSLVYRDLAKEYQAMNANAFTENTSPSNERGFYAGFSIRPAYGWKIEVFADYYQFPWLKYLVDAPSTGRDFLFELIYTPSKTIELRGRITYSVRLKEAARTGATDHLVSVPRTAGQLLLNYTVSRSFSLRSRFQLLSISGETTGSGFAFSLDGAYKPPMKNFSVSSRLQFFETTDYDSRLYAFENDVLYSHSIPAVFGNGFRYYIIAQFRPVKQLSIGMRGAQTIYSGQDEIGSGLDLISSNKRSELKLQFIYSIN